MKYKSFIKNTNIALSILMLFAFPLLAQAKGQFEGRYNGNAGTYRGFQGAGSCEVSVVFVKDAYSFTIRALDPETRLEENEYAALENTGLNNLSLSIEKSVELDQLIDGSISFRANTGNDSAWYIIEAKVNKGKLSQVFIYGVNTNIYWVNKATCYVVSSTNW